MMSKWISADSIINKFNSHVGFTTCADVERAIKLIQDEPGIDIVRCKDCKYAEDCEQMVVFENGKYITSGYKLDYCSYGEREGE